MTTGPASNELVLRRAFELAETMGAEVGGFEELTPRQLGAIAAEVGLPLGALAESLAEARVRVEAKRTLLDRLIGSGEISGHRSVARSEAEIDAALVDWLEVGHGLRARVAPDGVLIATRKAGLAGKISRGMRSVSGLGALGKARSVRGVSVEVDDDEGALCLVVDVGEQRRNALVGGSAVAAGGTSVALIFGFVAWPVAAVGVPVALGFGVATGRIAYRSTVAPIERDLDATLDQISSGDRPPTVLDSLGRGIVRGPRRGTRAAGRTARGSRRRGAGRGDRRDRDGGASAPVR